MKRKVRKPQELYETMRKAIVYMREHAMESPTSAHVAGMLGMSVSRFEHAFADWVGTTPKRFLSHLTKERAKALLLSSKDILRATYAAGLSGPTRLHELLVTYDAVSPGELKNGDVHITYGVHPSPFGLCFIAVTSRGVCRLGFLEKKEEVDREVLNLKRLWSNASLVRDDGHTEPYINKIFGSKKSKRPIHLLVKGTNFQLKVWEALLAIPPGRLAHYADIAQRIDSPKAVRAVGTACGNNPIAFLIPCHRVLTSDGKLGGYRWGIERKEMMLVFESVRKSARE